MALPKNPERGRQSNGASWVRNGVAQRNAAADVRADLLSKQRRSLRQRQFADGRWWRFRTKKPAISRATNTPIRINGGTYIIRCVFPYTLEFSANGKEQVFHNPMRHYEVQRIERGDWAGTVKMRFFSLAGVQQYLNELRRDSLLPLDDPRRAAMLPMVVEQPKREWKPSPFLYQRDALETWLLEQTAPQTQSILIQDLQDNSEVLAQIAAARSSEALLEQAVMDRLPVKPQEIDDLFEAIRFAFEHPYNDAAQLLPDGHRLMRYSKGDTVTCWHPWMGHELPSFVVASGTPYMKFVATREDVRAYLLKAKEVFEAKSYQPISAGERYPFEIAESKTIPFPSMASAAPKIDPLPADGPLTFPLMLDKTQVHHARIKIARFTLHDGSGNKDMGLGVWLESTGRTGKQANYYSLRAKIQSQGNLVQIDTGGAIKSSIPLPQWQAFVDRLDVEIGGVSVTTIQQTPMLDKMCRDVVAGRRKAPTVNEWEAEVAATESAAPDEADLSVTAAVPTVLKHGGKTFQTRKDSCAHIVVTQDVNAGRLSRKAGDPLCQPAGKFPRLLDFVPAGDPVCPKCAEMAERYDLPLPPNVQVVSLPSSRKLLPGDPPVRYKLDSRWFSYEYGFPFNGYLRSWKWLSERTVCQCGARISEQRSEEPVRGMEIYTYRTCTAGHPIHDERDLRWPGPRILKNAGVEGKSYDAAELLDSDAYKHLTAVPDPIDELPL